MTGEAKITINGKELSYAESMTVRVAISSFMMELKNEGLGEDEVGKQITNNYIKNCKEIENKIFGRM